ncbi:MAG: ComEA family DNA-binding protein [Actinomycetota bacterium]
MKDSFRERIASLSRAELAGLVVIIAVALGGAGLWYVRSLPKPVAITAQGSAPISGGGGSSDEVPAPAAPGAVSSPTAESVVIVDVAGWVQRPGVYEFAEGDRIIDAIEQAGGARRGASLLSLNLAAMLTDGQQIVVPEPLSRKERRALAEEGTSSPSGSEDGKVNVNTADATELETLSGIGEVLAERIVEYRDDNGPFASVDDLLDVSGIGDATLEDIRSDVTV